MTSPEATARANADQVLNQALQDETSARTNAYNDLYNTLTALQNQVTSLTQTVNTKVPRVKPLQVWTDLPLTSPFYYDETVFGPAFNRPQYMRTEDGFIHLRGIVGIGPGATGAFSTLPSGFGTIKESRFTKPGNGGDFIAQVSAAGLQLFCFSLAYPGGSVPSGTRSVFLDGITFYNDLN